MVDFKKLRAGKGKPNPVPPREIFHSLPKPVGINDLYASQAEVLDTWHARRNDKDVVVKLHTGGGKTLVALLMAQSIMNETGLPVLYLTPTNQLVGQGSRKAANTVSQPSPTSESSRFRPSSRTVRPSSSAHTKRLSPAAASSAYAAPTSSA
jgi:superfamily II DNA or RNA helicase